MLRNATHLAVILLLFSIVLTGCGGPGPEEAAQNALEATISGDFDTASKFFCNTMREDMPPQELIDEISKELKQYEFDFSGLKYEVVEQTNEAATIRVHGTIAAKGPDEEKNDDMDETIEMINEDGHWKVCE